MRRRSRLRWATLAALVTTGLVAACTDDTEVRGPTTAPSTTVTSTGPGAPSIVVLGDSVAAGEGIAYGYRYDLDATDPDRSTWSAGVVDPEWLDPYPRCHQTPEAYGHLVAAELGGVLTSFACTGATYRDGVVAPQVADGETYRPAQFGDWPARRDLNPDYDRARPDVVVLTLGADDLRFTSVVRFCVAGFTTSEAADVAALAAAAEPVEAVTTALADRTALLARAVERSDTSLRDDVESGYCTAANPGPVVERLFWEPIRSGALARQYRELVAAIRARGADPRSGGGRVPHVVVTTYHHPLPAGADGDCWDVFPLSGPEQAYLQSLQDELQRVIVEAVGDLEGVTVVDLSTVLDGHRWCSDDPWAYGMSILWFHDPASQAPFHPTPDGQHAIADVVTPAVRAAVAAPGG